MKFVLFEFIADNISRLKVFCEKLKNLSHHPYIHGNNIIHRVLICFDTKLLDNKAVIVESLEYRQGTIEERSTSLCLISRLLGGSE